MKNKKATNPISKHGNKSFQYAANVVLNHKERKMTLYYRKRLSALLKVKTSKQNVDLSPEMFSFV